MIDKTLPSVGSASGPASRGGPFATGLGLAILAFGLYCEDWRSTAWAVVSLVVCAVPLAAQWSRQPVWRVYALWFGVFVVAQALLTPLMRGNYVTLPSNLAVTVDVRTDAIPGYARGRRQVSTDERGWRVHPRVDYAVKRGPRVFAVGGSTTEDILLDDQATWTHRLQVLLRPEFAGVHVINTGVSGLRAANHIATVEVVAGLKPDLVLVLLGGNDWNKQIKDHFEHDRTRWSPPPLRETAAIRLLDRLTLTPLRRLLTGRSWADKAIVVERAEDMNGGRRSYGERHPRHSFSPERVAPGYAADLDRLGQLCTDRGLRCVFLTQPHAYGQEAPAELIARFWMTPPFASYGLELDSMRDLAGLYNAHLKTLAARGRHGICDIAAAMPPSRQLFYDDMHFTDDGAARVAEIAARCVRAELHKGSAPKP